MKENKKVNWKFEGGLPAQDKAFAAREQRSVGRIVVLVSPRSRRDRDRAKSGAERRRLNPANRRTEARRRQLGSAQARARRRHRGLDPNRSKFLSGFFTLTPALRCRRKNPQRERGMKIDLLQHRLDHDGRGRWSRSGGRGGELRRFAFLAGEQCGDFRLESLLVRKRAGVFCPSHKTERHLLRTVGAQPRDHEHPDRPSGKRGPRGKGVGARCGHGSAGSTFGGGDGCGGKPVGRRVGRSRAEVG